MSSPIRMRVLAPVLAVGVLAAACSPADEASGTTAPLPTFTTSTVPGDTEPTQPDATPPASSSGSSTEAPTTTAAPTLPPDTTPAPTTSTTTLPPTTTTTEPLSVEELVLRADGLGSARFGAAPDGVIEYVTSILGGNTGDTGWVDPLTFAVCDGDIARRVDWGSLSLLFSDLSDVAQGRRHFMGYEYGRVGQLGDEPVGLRTDGGTTLGSRVVDLLADFPEAQVNRGEEEINIPDNFYVSDDFYGILTGVEADDVVTVIFGGFGCGE